MKSYIYTVTIQVKYYNYFYLINITEKKKTFRQHVSNLSS